MAYWWVNHKQTRDHEIRGGYLWSPYRNTNGAFNQTYENMKLVRPGDIVFAYARGRIGGHRPCHRSRLTQSEADRIRQRGRLLGT